jgi:AI-2 transport protein TqsA
MLFNSTDLLGKATKIAQDKANEIASGGLEATSLLSGFGSQAVFFIIYLLFWIFSPISEDEPVVQILGTYVVLKSCCNLVYALLVGITLHSMNVGLAVVISILSFFLAYIPEVGAIIAIILPLPLVIFDHHQPYLLARVGKLGAVLTAMVLIKLLVSNFLESVVMGGNRVLAGAMLHRARPGETEKWHETHPIIVLVAVMVGAKIWGVTGMIVSVPVVALVRTYCTIMMQELDGDTPEDSPQATSYQPPSLPNSVSPTQPDSCGTDCFLWLGHV